MSTSYTQPDPSSLPVNPLATAYQSRRIWAAAVSISWNITLSGLFLATRSEWRLQFLLDRLADHHHFFSFASTGLAYLAILFLGFSLANYPIELWFGYLEERQFGLAKDGIRSWTRDWSIGVAQHALFFCAGSSILLFLQRILPMFWLLAFSVVLLALFISTSYFALQLLPKALFQIEPMGAADQKRVLQLTASSSLSASLMPNLLTFTAPNQRDFCGGITGIGKRQVLLLSRSTLSAASDSLLRFVILHDLGHRYYRHILLSTLAGWAWVILGIGISDYTLARFSPNSVGQAPYIAWLALTLSLWMAIGEPVLAYLGRRLEYQADRFYLRQGGTLAEIRTALEELSERNHARTEDLRRRHTIFHPLPSVWNRLYAAQRFVNQSETEMEC